MEKLTVFRVFWVSPYGGQNRYFRTQASADTFSAALSAAQKLLHSEDPKPMITAIEVKD